MDFLDIPTVVTVLKYKAEQFSSEHPEHTEDVDTFVREVNRITSVLQSSVYAREKLTRSYLENGLPGQGTLL
jgi:hypothetical protein